MSEFEIYRDDADEYRWRLRADNGEIVAQSSEGYTRKRDCENGLQNFRNAFREELEIRQHDTRVYQDDDGEWRWQYTHDNGNIIAVGEGYTTEDACERGLAVAMFYAGIDQTDISDETGE